jgi:hypothetical protein
MFQTQLPIDKSRRIHKLLPLLSGFLVVVILISINVGGEAHAASAAATATNAAVAYADSHWNCATAACTSRVPAGSGQNSFQYAEFVARSLAAEGKVPGLTSNSSQSAYGSYHARNGQT